MAKKKQHDTRRAVTNDSPVTMQALIAGLILSAGLTLLAYNAVVGEWVYGNTAVLVVMGLAIIQLIVQLVFFLHFGREKKPRWNMRMFYFMLIFLGILVIGSLWIMYNLNYNMMDMTPHEMDMHMMEESDKGF